MTREGGASRSAISFSSNTTRTLSRTLLGAFPGAAPNVLTVQTQSRPVPNPFASQSIPQPQVKSRIGVKGVAIPVFCVLLFSAYFQDAEDHRMSININGRQLDLPGDPRVSLLDLLRDHLDLAGTKKGCNQGACGACTVLVDGERILSCLALAVQYEGRSVTTVEGLSMDGNMHPLQAAFIEHDGFQCGYCTPGQICSAIGMLGELKRGLPSNVTGDITEEAITLTRDELCERMSGNLCRCGAYNGIVDAITAFAETTR
jgi:xanthine dehydrogenase YagT iron-sulfur-binding subunit